MLLLLIISLLQADQADSRGLLDTKEKICDWYMDLLHDLSFMLGLGCFEIGEKSEISCQD